MGMRDLLYETWHALASNKGRSILTILGIVIGISAVISMTAVIAGMQNMLVSQLGLNQSRLVYISVATDKTITFDDLAAIKNGVEGYDYVTGGAYASAGTVSSGTRSDDTATLEGVEPVYFEANGTKLVKGRFFTEDEQARGALVCVLSQSEVKTLFGSLDYDAVGKSIKIGNDTYSVIGIIESSSALSFGPGIYLPFTTMQARITGTIGLSEIDGYASAGTDMNSLTTRTISFLTSYFKVSKPDENISVTSMDSIMNQFKTMMSAFSAIMAAVAGISLFVGGIGIMNMMLTNVTERIREIGLRKSLGARKRDITRQFLLESITLCVIGGIFGILFGYLGAWVLSGIISIVRSDISITPVVTGSSVLLAVGVCILIGVIFGYYPARRAAKLNPVDSLRYQ